MIGYMKCNQCGRHWAESGRQLGTTCPQCDARSYTIDLGRPGKPAPDWYKGGEPVAVGPK